MNGWNLAIRAAYTVLTVLFVGVLVLLFVPKVRQLRTLQSRETELRKENRLLEAQIQELKNNQEKFTRDPAFVERVARETGLISPGELVYRATNTPSPVQTRGGEEGLR